MAGGLKGIACGGFDGYRYVGIGDTLDQVIVSWRSSRRLFTIILIGGVLPIFFDILRILFYFLIGKVKKQMIIFDTLTG